MLRNDADKISRGIKYIIDLLNQVNTTFLAQISPYYNLPRFIYRGIRRFYPYNDPDGYSNSHPNVEEVMNDYIRSGLSVKLHYTSNKESDHSTLHGYIRVNYLNAIENLLRNARKHYPERYPNTICDLNVLADIQHNGGATCLVDFSKNILTALWFACNGDFDHDGFIYCYDIMEDMIVKDALMYIKSEDEKNPIRSLLLQTYKETNISSDVSERFCIWEPSPMNHRILRQDSVFVFGIEKFCVKEHGMKVIKIPAEQKTCILQAMKGLFNISRNTIYNDYVGYASANSKEISDNRQCTTSYDNGYVNMIRGNFDTALDYFKLWEGDNKWNMSEEMGLELSFSLAVCYKNLKTKNIRYLNNAIIEYDKVIAFARNILKRPGRTGQDYIYYRKKCTRAYNGIMDLMYEMERYKEGIDVCDKIIYEIENGCLKCNQFAKTEVKDGILNPRYCRIVKMELLVLNILRNLPANDERNRQKALMNNFYKEAISCPGNSYFDKLLIEYYKLVFDIMVSRQQSIAREYKHRTYHWRETISNYRGEDKYEGYILWNFEDIKTP